MTLVRDNRTVFASGMIRSGKSQLLEDWVRRVYPRVVSFDPVGDTMDRNPNAIPVYSVDELRAHIRKATAAGCARWHFAFIGNDDDAPALFRLFAPKGARLDAPSLSRALGGVLIECGECDVIAPNGKTAPDVKHAWQRGRHYLLSLAMATQRPAATDRMVTGQSQFIAAFMHSEARDLDYFAATISARAAEEIQRLEPYHFVWHRKGDAFATVYGPGGRAARNADGTYARRALRRIDFVAPSPLPVRVK